jgi:hypothetical protein
MSTGHPSKLDTERARQLREAYQRQYDVSDRIGQTVGIDPLGRQI